MLNLNKISNCKTNTMKRISLLLIFSTLIFFVFSCKSDEKAREEAAEDIVEGLLENASGGNVDIDVDEKEGTAEMTIEGEDGTKIKVSSGGKEIPENFPNDIFLVKGEIESAGTMASDEGELITVVINPENSFDDVTSEIKKEMKAKGWTSSMNMNMNGEAMMMYAKGDNSVTITVSGEDKIQAAYLATVAKK